MPTIRFSCITIQVPNNVLTTEPTEGDATPSLIISTQNIPIWGQGAGWEWRNVSGTSSISYESYFCALKGWAWVHTKDSPYTRRETPKWRCSFDLESEIEICVVIFLNPSFVKFELDFPSSTSRVSSLWCPQNPVSIAVSIPTFFNKP